MLNNIIKVIASQEEKTDIAAHDKHWNLDFLQIILDIDDVLASNTAPTEQLEKYNLTLLRHSYMMKNSV